MNCCDNAVCQRMKTLAAEAESYIDLLYAVPCMYTKNLLLYQLRSKIEELDFLNEIMCSQVNQMKIGSAELLPQYNKKPGDLTLDELAKFNGKGGNPAYVAVNGTVYDVTNNAAWAAASHFGLSAGKDLTREFASCHPGQSILNKLKVAGKLI